MTTIKTLLLCLFAILLFTACEKEYSNENGPAALATAEFTLLGAPDTCTAFTVAGTYIKDVALTNVHTVTIQANVTVPGSYTISSTTANGISFTAIGSFITTGVQSVVLKGSGTPADAGTASYQVGQLGCTFRVVTIPTYPPATFTLTGGPGACLPVTTNGTYFTGIPLNSDNSVIISVNVSGVVPGSYSITTNTVNGIHFSAAGIFTSPGIQMVKLMGAGTPQAAGQYSFAPLNSNGSAGCSFTISTVPLPTDIIKCKVDGEWRVFNIDPSATLSTNSLGTTSLDINSEANGGTSPEFFSLVMVKTSPIIAETFDQSTVVDNKTFSAQYTDPSALVFVNATGAPIPFTITILSLTATRVTGTFSGTVKQPVPVNPASRLLTEGIFNVPIL